MGGVTHLLDKSAWIQIQYSKEAARLLAGLIRQGDLALCTVTALEILYSARDSKEYDRDYTRLSSLPWVDLSEPRRAVELQRELALRGWHRTPLPDVVIAATAAEHHMTVLHYDSDYERLSTVGGFEQRWIIPRGEGHGRDSSSR
jgi:predicted nucleic acid-binding protein